MPASLAPVLAGQPYSQMLTASGGLAPYTFSVTAGALPPGLQLNPASGVLAGTPSTPGSFSFTATARDANGCVGSQAYTQVVNQAVCPVIGLAPTSLPVMVVGQPFSQSFSGSGGSAPYSFALTAGNLPPGLSLNPQTGQLSGTPATAGVFSFTITVTDSQGCSRSRPFNAQVAVSIAPVGIPALSSWMLALLGGIFGLIGFVALRLQR
jgi:hypothetical protein